MERFGKYYFAFFFVGFSYVLGQMNAGLFFNSFIWDWEWWPWRYFPYKYVHGNFEQLAIEVDYQNAIKIIDNSSFSIGNERITMLQHLTGYGSSMCLFIAIVNFCFLFKNIAAQKLKIGLLLIIAPLIISRGLFLHFRELTEKTFLYKTMLIRQAKNLTRQENVPDSQKSKFDSIRIYNNNWNYPDSNIKKIFEDKSACDTALMKY